MPRTLPHALSRVSLSLKKLLIGPDFHPGDSFCPHLLHNESARRREQQGPSCFAKHSPP
jgi:hypothetical protein